MSPYLTRSKTAADVSPAETATTSSRFRRVILHVRSRGSPVSRASSPTPLTPAHVADPLASPVAHSPLKPLFLGMDDDVIPSPLPSPFLAAPPLPMGSDTLPISPAVNLYKVDVRHPGVEVTTPEHQAIWEAELAWLPTLPPTTNEVVDAVLAASRATTPVFRLEIQPLMPPPHWVRYQTPPPPLPDRHHPTNVALHQLSATLLVSATTFHEHAYTAT
ncbi:hypothetical protein NDA18_000158 [Ustilago nuda]|nr:hypothetical protein NDA18_000158 [Ustilago nuda]